LEEIGGYKYGDIIKGWRWSKEIIQINISIKKDNIKIDCVGGPILNYNDFYFSLLTIILIKLKILY
jgi:hypothetical protein